MAKKKPRYAGFTKSDLIQKLSQKHNTTKVMAGLVVNTVLNSITNTLKQGNRIEIRGFGTFEIRKYRSYQGRNPQTGGKSPSQSQKAPLFQSRKIQRRN